MPTFNSAGTWLHYEDSGNGVPLILLHGFGLSARTCWYENGWRNALSDRGFRPIALDSRGHGLSEKLYDASKYGAAEMTSDVLRLMDHLGVKKGAHNRALYGRAYCILTSFDGVRQGEVNCCDQHRFQSFSAGSIHFVDKGARVGQPFRCSATSPLNGRALA